MQRAITPAVIANTAMMIRMKLGAGFPVFIVEGRSDLRLYKKIMKNCGFLPANGKEKVIESIKIIQDRMLLNPPGLYAAIFDQDYDGLLGVSYSNETLFITDRHDLECHMLESEALDAVFREYCDAQKACQWLGISDDDIDRAPAAVRQALLRTGVVFGSVRYVNARDSLGISFRRIRHEKILNSKSIEVSLERYIDNVVINNPNVDRVHLQVEAKKALEQNFEPWLFCQGHDLVKLFVAGMRRAWGKGGAADELHIEKGLRLAFSREMFAATPFGSSILKFVGNCVLSAANGDAIPG